MKKQRVLAYLGDLEKRFGSKSASGCASNVPPKPKHRRSRRGRTRSRSFSRSRSRARRRSHYR